MKTVAIKSEYNPFHNGHLHQIKMIRKLFGETVSIINLLSSNYVQRGEPALTDKYSRADMAICNGSDMVLEYPSLFCCQSAEAYADNAVYILNNIGIIDYIIYGSKSFHNDNIKRISKILSNETSEYKEALKKELSKGISFPKARENALCKLINTPDFLYDNLSVPLKSSNDILAIEYEKAIIRQKSVLCTLPIERIGSDYNDPCLNGCYSSATAIRTTILSDLNNLQAVKGNIPYSTFNILQEYSKNKFYGSFDLFSDIISYSIISKCIKEIRNFPLINEGLENLLKKNVPLCNSVNELIQRCTTKRYPSTRIQRLLMHMLLGADNDIYYQLFYSGGINYEEIF